MHGAVPARPPPQVQGTVVAVVPVQAGVLGGGQVHTPAQLPSAPQSWFPCCRSGQTHERALPASQAIGLTGGAAAGPQAIASTAKNAANELRMGPPGLFEPGV